MGKINVFPSFVGKVREDSIDILILLFARLLLFDFFFT